ncbi:uncharacterized protein K444DRAFT_613336 [Hyaloscypha bicolor E]|uniref:Uncharacterized protein n=1 Tax=Hyaloscypha bicolor E TaxID=1095630 RepID=A0A2J6T8K2_9HELO|nr:uncharacterized protein K444DRAFT_613336 [Hyaloscypha bicolor E]PMD59360.1 hypothetical protein K444DRAFT_613336 [Hyaloscypha bicolor E]
MAGMDMGAEFTTSPECYATDDSFLQTLAYCMSTHCSGVSEWKLEQSHMQRRCPEWLMHQRRCSWGMS